VPLPGRSTAEQASARRMVADGTTVTGPPRILLHSPLARRKHGNPGAGTLTRTHSPNYDSRGGGSFRDRAATLPCSIGVEASMTPPLRHPSMRSIRPIGAVVAACLLLVLAAPRSEASCGDWLEGHGTTRAEAAHAGIEQGTVAPVDAAGDRLVRVPLPGRRPCNGPSCGRAPAPLPFSPGDAPVVSVDLEGDAMLSSAVVLACQGSTALIEADETLLPAAVCGRPERPPRAS